MNMQTQTKAYQLIEQLLNNGHNFSTLPIPRERAMNIFLMREDATLEDLQALQSAASDNSTRQVPKIGG